MQKSKNKKLMQKKLKVEVFLFFPLEKKLKSLIRECVKTCSLHSLFKRNFFIRKVKSLEKDEELFAADFYRQTSQEISLYGKSLEAITKYF